MFSAAAAAWYPSASMDVTIVRSSVFELPSNQRVGAIVVDGACDLRLWPGPGADRDLDEVYGGGLQRALDTERGKLGVERVDLGSITRVHPGRLHCDFLAWAATRPPEPGTERSPAPAAERLREAVLSALEFVAARSVERVAFPALGAGPGEIDRAERLAIIVRAAHEYEERCFEHGRPPVVEEVLVCEPLPSVVRDVQQRVRRLAKATAPEPESRPKPPGPAAGSGTSRKRATRAKKPPEPSLSVAEISAARASAPKYSMRERYAVGDFILHPKFGVGRVEEALDVGAIVVVFEGGDRKKLVHGR